MPFDLQGGGGARHRVLYSDFSTALYADSAVTLPANDFTLIEFEFSYHFAESADDLTDTVTDSRGITRGQYFINDDGDNISYAWGVSEKGDDINTHDSENLSNNLYVVGTVIGVDNYHIIYNPTTQVVSVSYGGLLATHPLIIDWGVIIGYG